MIGKFALPVGRLIEFGVNDGWIAWRYAGALVWKNLFKIPGGGENGSFNITDGEETITISTNDEITLTGNGIDIEVFEDENDETKKEISFKVNDEKITEIVKTETDKNKTSYLYDKYEDETLTHETGWTVEEWTEKIGHLKAVVSIFDIDEQTLVTLQNIMAYDFINGEFKADNEIIKDVNDKITLKLDIDDGKLIAVVEGMNDNSKRIFLCFERCFDGVESEIDNIYYGLLYNWYVVDDERNIANEGWETTPSEVFADLIRYLYDFYELGDAPETKSNIPIGCYLKVLGTMHWNEASIGNNEHGFNAKGAGQRTESSGTFLGLKSQLSFWHNEILSTPTSSRAAIIYSGSCKVSTTMKSIKFGFNRKRGISIRLIKTTTDLQDGETGIYTGNDGRIYPTICINGVEWLAENLAETKFRDGSIIPWYGADKEDFFTKAEWVDLETPACCAYDNDVANVAEDFEFPDY